MTLHVETRGHGPDVVLVHGWGWHGGVWRDVATRLADRYRVWLPDLPGHGRSGTGAEAASVGAYAQALRACVPAQALWVGWSLGGMVALEAACGGDVRALVLVATTPRFIQALDWTSAWSQDEFDRFENELQTDVRRGLERFASLHLAHGRSDRALLRRLRSDLMQGERSSPAALRAGLHVLAQTDLRARLADRAIPSLVVHGTRDQVIPYAAGANLGQVLPQARFLCLPDAGHALLWTHSDTIADAVTKFLDEGL